MRSKRWFPRSMALVLITLTGGFPDGADAVAGTLLERTVAFVNKKPVLLSDVDLTKALLRLDEKEAVERAIDESLMFEDASRLLNQPPSEDAVAAARLSLQEKAGPGFGPSPLRRKAVIQITIANYIELRLRPLVRVEDAEVRRAFNERVVSDPEPPSFSLVAPSLRESLERESLDQKIEEWVAALRRTAEIRHSAPRP